MSGRLPPLVFWVDVARVGIRVDRDKFITAEKGGVARAKGVEEKEKEKECTTECKSQGEIDSHG